MRFPLYGNSGFAPEIMALLSSLDDDACSYEHYGLRHPADIFNSVFMDVAQKFVALLKSISLSQISNLCEPRVNDKSSELYQDLLEACSRYIDCGYEVILSLCEKQPRSRADRGFLHQWLESQDKKRKDRGFGVGKVYYSIIRKNISFFRDLNNDLKHSSNCLRPVTVMVGLKPCLGYFLEVADSDGYLVPSPELHKSLDGATRTANSFNRDLRLLYCSVYLIADALKRAIIVLYNQRHQCDPPIDLSRRYEDGIYKDLFERLANLPQIYFSKEAGKLVPVARISVQKDRYVLLFSEEKVPLTYGPFRVATQTVLHRGGKLGFKLPLP